MEFYVLLNFKNLRLSRVSIPNGMEFYPKRFKRMAPLRAVSIPNGMEFYDEKGELKAYIAEFQFPTGWNSTGDSAVIDTEEERFNSQRDGILLTRRRWLYSLCSVSIPNGMEFYALLAVRALATDQCFNSQRDGILHT